MALSRAVRAQVLTSDRSMSLMCVPSHTHDPTWPTQDLRFQRNKNILVTTCYNQLASVASKKPFGETLASGHHRRIPRSPSRRSAACLAKGGICMFCDASQTARHWKGICSCFMPHNYLTKSSHSIWATQCHHQSRSQSGMTCHGAKERVLFPVELLSMQLMFEQLSGCTHHVRQKISPHVTWCEQTPCRLWLQETTNSCDKNVAQQSVAARG